MYIARAREGSERLGAILTAMGAATKVEEAIAHSERHRFDLRSLVRTAVDAYSDAFPKRRFACEVPADPVEMTGAPELMVQLLDKLVDNAVDFSADGATISVVLRADDAHAELSVANPGPPLPPEADTRLFESLWQSRAEADKRPHFGLGLYIVRLIAEFHGGSARAANLPDGVRGDLRRPSDPLSRTCAQGLIQPTHGSADKLNEGCQLSRDRDIVAKSFRRMIRPV